MCNILFLKAGQMPLERSEFDNMCRNNWHSYGLVTIVDGRMDVKRVVPESGEIDPNEVWDLLVKDRKFDRYLHVRHTTAGTTSVENCHPFDVFYQERSGSVPRQVVFMHNGTLYEYKSKKLDDRNILVDDDTGPSDTQNYVNRVLIPYISAIDFGDGKGDIASPHLEVLLKKFWPATSNRGLLISNDQKPLILGDWKKMKASDGSDILSSNDDYFRTLVRGPYKERLDEEDRKKKESSFRNSSGTSTGGNSSKFNNETRTFDFNNGITPYTVFDFTKDRKHGLYELTTSFANVIDDWNVWDRGTAVNLGFATQTELKALYASGEKNTVLLMDWIFSDYKQLYDEFNEIDEKHKKATDRIATIQAELNDLRKLAKEAGLYDKKAA